MFDNYFRKDISWGGQLLTLETGKVARQADGAVVAQEGQGREPALDDGDALAVFHESWSTAANWLGPIVFVLAVAGCYRFVQGLGRKS